MKYKVIFERSILSALPHSAYHQRWHKYSCIFVCTNDRTFISRSGQGRAGRFRNKDKSLIISELLFVLCSEYKIGRWNRILHYTTILWQTPWFVILFYFFSFNLYFYRLVSLILEDSFTRAPENPVEAEIV